MLKSISYLFLVSMTAFAFGCGSDDTDGETTSTDTSADTSADATPAREGTTSIEQTVIINDWVAASPVEGAEVCWAINDGEATCVETDAEGQATGSVDVLPGDQLHLSGSKTGYYPFTTTYIVPEMPVGGSVSWALVQDAIVDLLTMEVGEEADAEKGHVTALVFEPSEDGDSTPLANATVTMISGTASQGPNYTNLAADVSDAGLFAQDGATTDAGIAVFNNVTPGSVTLQVTADGKTCTASAGRPTGSDNEVEISVEAGVVSYTSFQCE